MARISDKIATKLLIIIVVLAAIVRLWGLADNPASLYWEEAALGYDAYAVLETGKDYHGNAFPIVSFPSFGDYKPSLYFYAAMPSVYFFGLNEFAIRFPSAVAGIFSVFLLYFISRQIRLSRKVSLIASLLLTISPWHIQFSRAAFEVNLALALYMTGIYFFLDSRRKQRHLFISALTFSLSMYAYHGMRILAPLTALGLYLFFKNKFKPKYLVGPFLLASILLFPILANISNPQVNQRFKETSMFSVSSAVSQTNYLRNEAGNSIISRVVFHRYWWWVGELVENYTKNFSLKSLFLEGDGNPRHGTGEFGLLYHWEIISIGYAIMLYAQKKDKKLTPIFLWILITPIATALTKTNPHALRTLSMAPALAIISAYGLEKLTHLFSAKKVIGVFLAGIVMFEAGAYAHFYTDHYPSESAEHWQYGYKQTIEYVEEIKDQYEHIYFTRAYGRPSIYALFYGWYDPVRIQSISASAKHDQLELLEFEKYIFDAPPSGVRDSLIVISGKEEWVDREPMHTIFFPDGQKAFLIYEI